MLEEIQKSLQETQNFLTETVEKVSNSTQEPITTGKNSLNQGFQTLTETGNSAINKITGVAEKAKDSLTKITDQSIEQLNVTTSQAIDKLTETADKAQTSLNETIQNAEKITNTAVEASQQAIAASFANWLDAHPILAWLIAHPILTLVLLLLLWLLLGGLFRAIARLTEQVWLSAFQSPIKLGQWLLGRVPQPFLSSFNLRTANPSSNSNDKEQRLSSILSRLEEIKQEQEELWKEIITILGLKP